MSEKAEFNLRNPVHFLALGFGSGLIKPAPGTWGTLAGIPIYYLLAQFSQQQYIISTVILAIVGIYLCGKAARDAGVHDHGSIVWDEIVGLLITMALVPTVHFIWLAVGFAYFRLFDIIKPFPISLCDKYIKGGFGIMLDDVLAGLLAMIALHYSIQAYLYYIYSL